MHYFRWLTRISSVYHRYWVPVNCGYRILEPGSRTPSDLLFPCWHVECCMLSVHGPPLVPIYVCMYLLLYYDSACPNHVRRLWCVYARQGAESARLLRVRAPGCQASILNVIYVQRAAPQVEGTKYTMWARYVRLAVLKGGCCGT